MHTFSNIKFPFNVSKPYAPVYMQAVERCQKVSKEIQNPKSWNLKTLNTSACLNPKTLKL